MARFRRVAAWWSAVGFAACAAATHGAYAADGLRAELEMYFASKDVDVVRLSPNGKQLVALGRHSNASAIVLMDADTLAARLVTTSSRFFRGLEGVRWVADDLLAIDYDGVTKIIDLQGKDVTHLGHGFLGRRNAADLSTDWLLTYHGERRASLDLVDARTGRRIDLGPSLPGRPIHWAFDARGTLRAVTMYREPMLGGAPVITNWYRDSAADDWRKLQEIEARFGADEAWVPLAVLPEAHRLAILSRQERDTYAVFRYDTYTRQHLDVMAGHPTEDLRSAIGFDQPTFSYVETSGMKRLGLWLDPQWAAIQKAVDAAMPQRLNLLVQTAGERVLVFSYADVDPGRWFVLDRPTMALREVVARTDKIDPMRMRPTEIVDYPAPDGLVIHGYLTRPAGEGPAPMVVLVHGGPVARDHWGYDPEVQFLAGQGYAVFQPQFRGSDGFGRRFMEAGFRQFGRAMQDDVTAGVRALAARGVVDPRRVCIYGASYGGYAALWGVIKDPDLYRCGISLAGVSDLTDLVSFSLFDDSDAESRAARRLLIGDASTMKDELRAVSPIEHAQDVRVPLLIAHGERDTRVLFSQSRRMVERLRELHKDVEWMPFENVGHGFYWKRDQFRFEEAVAGFLKRHLGAAPDAPAATAAASAPAADSSRSSAVSP